MKTLMFTLVLLTSISAFARTPYDTLIKSCEFGRGECHIQKYNVSKFDYKAEAKKITANLNETEIPYFKRNDVYDAIYSIAGFEDGSDAFFNNLSKLFKTNKIQATFGIAPHPEKCTESEYCSSVSATIFTNDGYIISIYFDYNT
ncbi:MAG: hypothetical protein ACOVP4_01550 [Bacteriovoracaceae bacterium]